MVLLNKINLYKRDTCLIFYMDQYSNKQKKILFEKINKLSKTEHEEIYKILVKHNSSDKENSICFTRNKNGVFFNLSGINDILYEQLDNFVNYCISNQKNLDDYDKKINECKINNNYTNIIHINFETLPKEHSEIKKMNAETQDWNAILTDAKSIQRISTYVEKLMTDKEKVGKKKVNIKFNVAKKKFAKKVYSDSNKKFDSDNITLLTHDPYLINT